MDNAKGLRVLICDDSDINREILSMMLTDNGMHSEEAKDGQEAVQKWMESEKGTFDAIVMDLMMPVMSGFSAIRRIRMSSRPDAEDVLIIALSGSEYAHDREKALAAGADVFMIKPVSPELLAETLEKNCKLC